MPNVFLSRKAGELLLEERDLGELDEVNLSAPATPEVVDAANERLANLVRDYTLKHKTTFDEAMKHVVATRPRLAKLSRLDKCQSELGAQVTIVRERA